MAKPAFYNPIYTCFFLNQTGGFVLGCIKYILGTGLGMIPVRPVTGVVIPGENTKGRPKKVSIKKLAGSLELRQRWEV
jgi:hypothetical protein